MGSLMLKEAQHQMDGFFVYASLLTNYPPALAQASMSLLSS